MFDWLRSLFGKSQDRRARPRTAAVNAYVRIDQRTYAVDDIDAHHFRILDYEGDLIEGQRFGFHFIIHLSDGSRDSFPGHGRVIRIDTLGLAANFLETQPLFKKEIHDFIAAQPPA